jgi:hypothetical protein
VDEGHTEVRVTLIARRNLTVVVDGVRVHVKERRSPPQWPAITCAVGGASISPRRAEIRLDGFAQPTVAWVGEGDQHGQPPPTFSISESEAEMIHLWAYAESAWVEWTAELLVLVDGQRRIIEISDSGNPFITVGSPKAAHHVWLSGSDKWEPAIS